MKKLFPSRLAALAIGAALAATGFTSHAAAFETCCGPEEGPSWIFAPSTYTHDPMTGARVGQYARIEPVEPLPDQRNVTSGYRRTVTNIRGTDGSLDTSYQVQNWANGRGGLDAEWERVNDAWQQAYLTGSSFTTQNGFHDRGRGWGKGGWGNGNWGNGSWGPGNGGPSWNNGGPGWGNGPGNWGGPGNGGPGNGWNGPNNGSPPQGNNGPPQNGGPDG
jgi:hypothetical protein